MSTLQTGVPNPPVVSREVVVSSSSLHLGGPQYRSRHPVETGAEARGMEASPRGGGADMEGVRPGTIGYDCAASDVSLSTLVLPHTTSSSGLDAMVQTWPRLRLYAFPPIALLLGVLERVRRDRVLLTIFHPQPELWKLWAWPLRGPSS